MILAREKEVDNEYHAPILRCTLSDLKRKGALIHKASQWLNRKEVQNNASIKPKWDETEHSWDISQWKFTNLRIFE